MTYADYQKDVKPKTKIEASKKIIGWRCKICGYVYEGEDLPSDFICPWCKHGVEDFERSVEEKYGEASWQGLFSGNSNGVTMDIVYEPSINEFRGNRSVQIIIENFK